jgi:pyruvate ferredoxin oxidoreductase delta subunit
MTSKEKSWREISIAGICWKPNTEFLTGDWKTYKPVRDPEKCTLCLICAIFCPDGAIRLKREGEYIEFNYDFCKGCGICANECPVKAIEMKLE